MDFAFSFDCPLSFSEVMDRLNAIGPWRWEEADSAWYGNLARARTDALRLDLAESGPNEVPGGRFDAGNGQRYCISVRWRGGAGSAAESEALAARVRDVILPRLGARGVQPTDTID